MRTVYKFLALFSVSAVMTFSSGCASLGFLRGKTKDESAAADLKKEQKRAGRELLVAFLDNDSGQFFALLPRSVQEGFTKKSFEVTRETMLKELGTPVSYKFIMNLEHPTFTISIWKIRFERKKSDGSKNIYQETLFRAVSGKIDGKETLLSFNFF